MSTPRVRARSNPALAFLSTVAALLLAELLVRIFTPFPITFESNQREQGELGYVLSPRLLDVDEYGFRNPLNDNERYDNVAIGDSHTFGSNVSWMEGWPAPPPKTGPLLG